mmetsp:Transcript_7069/g.14570  ORF Transcript_7069/g.14570 Transcript_7069/m.14570 type:complete len:93 (+) Transcript_7069:888-1166(+)
MGISGAGSSEIRMSLWIHVREPKATVKDQEMGQCERDKPEKHPSYPQNDRNAPLQRSPRLAGLYAIHSTAIEFARGTPFSKTPLRNDHHWPS